MASSNACAGVPKSFIVPARPASPCSFILPIRVAAGSMGITESNKGSDHPEEEKKVSSTLEKLPGKEMDLVDQVWKHLVKTTHQAFSTNDAFNIENGFRFQDLYCAILLLYNDINKTLRPGPHRDPPLMEEIQKCLRSYGDELNENTVLDRVDFKLFFENFTENTIRRDELQALFKTGANQQSVRLGLHTKQESDYSSQEAGPSRNVKTEDSQDALHTKKSKEGKNAAGADAAEAPNGGTNILHGRTESAANLNSFSGGSHFQIFNLASADMDSLATFVKQIRK